MTHDEMTRKWKDVVNNSSHIFTWTEPLTLAYLAEEASKAKNIIESGTYMGASARVMLDANPDCHLWAFDLFPVAGTLEVSTVFLGDHIASHRCEIIKKDSTGATEMLQHMKGQIDMAFIDDGHAEEDLRRDIDNILPLLRPGGIMIGHDWEGTNDVSRGVLSRLPMSEIFLPVPRTWAHIKK